MTKKKRQKLTPGETFGAWILEHELGKGGNSVVWRAKSKSTENSVAIKFLHQHLFQSDSKKLQRFRDEIEFMRRHKDDSGILPLIEAHLPEDPTIDNRPWFVTPLAQPCNSFFDGDNRSSEKIVRFIHTIASTLARFHEQDEYHRDIKPDNLFLLENRPVVGDWGLVDMPNKTAVTEDDEIVGPLFYVAPEMMHSAADKAGAAADVYSLAKTMWVLATGQRYPLPGHQNRAMEALTLGAYVSNPRCRLLDSVIDTCTHPMPEKRPSMTELRDLLDNWLNPPSRNAGNIDLADLVPQIRGVMSEVEQLEADSQTRKKEVEEVISSVSPTMEEIRKHLSEATGRQLRLYQDFININIPQLQLGPRSGYLLGLFVHLSRGGSTGVHLRIGFATQNTPDNRVEMVAFNVLQVREYSHESTEFYRENRICLPSSPQLEQEAANLCQGLRESLPNAVRRWIEVAEKYPANRG